MTALPSDAVLTLFYPGMSEVATVGGPGVTCPRFAPGQYAPGEYALCVSSASDQAQPYYVLNARVTPP